MTKEKYKILRKKLGTQQEVAELLGVTRHTIGLREAGDPRAKITKEAELAIRFLSLN